MRTAGKLTFSRAKALNPYTVQHFFSFLKLLIEKHNLTAERIFNMDEKGFDGEAMRKRRICAPKYMKHVNQIASNFRDHWSVNAIASAAGLVCPPLFVFKGELTPISILNGAPLGSAVAMQENGYFTKELLAQVISHILKYTENILKPLLLIIDGSKTHLDVKALELASEKGIEILCLPANTTHRLQPLDVSVFGPLNAYWQQACSRFRLDRGFGISKYDCTSVFSQPWQEATSVKNIQAGFRNTGIWPFNPEKVTPVDMKPAIKVEESSEIKRQPLGDITSHMINTSVSSTSQLNQQSISASQSVTDLLIEKQQLLSRIEQLEKDTAKSKKKPVAPKLNTTRATLLTAPEILQKYREEENVKQEKKLAASQKKKKKPKADSQAIFNATSKFAIKSFDTAKAKVVLKRISVSKPSVLSMR